MALMGFGGFDDMFGNMDRMVNSMMRSMMGGTSADPFAMVNSMMGQQNQMLTAHPMNMMMSSMTSMPGTSYSYSSQVISYSSDGSGRPQVYESTQSTHLGPNGVKQTESSVRDSRTGRQEMTIGRHIRDRGHVMSRKRNVYTGDEEDENEYINIEEEEATDFHNEFAQQMHRSRAPRQLAIGSSSGSSSSSSRRQQPLAIEAGPASTPAHHQHRHHHHRDQHHHYHQQQQLPQQHQIPQQLHHHHHQPQPQPQPQPKPQQQIQPSSSSSHMYAYRAPTDLSQYEQVPSPGVVKKAKKSKKERKPYHKSGNQ